MFNKNVDGVIVEKNFSHEKFGKIINMFDDIPKVMLINGLVIITDLSVSKIRSYGLSFFNAKSGTYTDLSNESVLIFNEMSIAIPDNARARILFRIPGIKYVLCIHTSPRDPNHNNTFKCVALLFNGTISRENPVSIILFGTKPISQRNENQYQTISVGGVQAVGHKQTIPIQCNEPDLPFFLVAIIFNGVPNPPTNIPPALNLDLFILQISYLEYVKDFTSSFQH
ncbi:hypothetical protein ACTFIZ_011516 [Dictyostelium cf. discoideum]